MRKRKRGAWEGKLTKTGKDAVSLYPRGMSNEIVWHGWKQDISPEIKKCLEANGFVEDGQSYSLLINDRYAIHYTQSGQMSVFSLSLPNFYNRIVSLQHFSTIEDWNWAVNHIENLGVLKIMGTNVSV